MAIDKDVLDQLLAGRGPGELFAKDGLLDELKKAPSEHMLSAAACSFRDGTKSSRREDGVGNARAAHSATPCWRHTPRRSMLYAAGPAIAPSHTIAAGAASDFIWTPVW